MIARKLRRGFTLIEVLVALAIVAITLGAGIRAAGALADNGQRLVDVTAAQWCADNQLTGLQLAKLTPPLGDTTFTCTQLGRTYFGTLVTRPTSGVLYYSIEARIADETGRPMLSVTTVRRK